MTGNENNQDDGRNPRIAMPDNRREPDASGGDMRAPSDMAPPQDARVPEARRRRRGMVRRLGGLLTGIALFFIVALAGAGGVYYYGNSKFDAAGPLAEQKSIMIKRGQSSRSIAAALAREGFISHDKLFLLGLYANGANGKLQAGEYDIAAGTSMRGVMNMLVQGKAIQHKITVPEGLTTMQILARIEDHPILEGKIEQAVAEGSLLPDTYAFPRGTTRQDVVKQMQQAQTAFMAKAWAKRAKDLPVRKPYEALILASIIEKETARASERGRVASVFVNRMRRRMRLQSDPTIIYGIVGGKGKLGRPLTKADIAKETKYNTYRIDGLPPTPISNPGREAIEAVLNPLETSDLYFVADGTGGHAFAPTLDEHNSNVAVWRKIERERREARRAKEENEAKTASEGSTAEEPAAGTPEPAVAATGEPAAPEPQGQSEQPDQIITQAVPQSADDVQTGSVAKVQDQIVTQPSTAATDAPAAAEAPAQPAWQHTQIESPKVPEQTAAVTPAPAPAPAAPSASEEPAPAAPSGPALSILQTEPAQPQTDAVKPRTKPEASTTAGTSAAESAPQPAPTELVLKNVPLPRPKPARPGGQTGEAENTVVNDAAPVVVIPDPVPARTQAAPAPAAKPTVNLK